MDRKFQRSFISGAAAALSLFLHGCEENRSKRVASPIQPGQVLYEASCAACHQVHGNGMEGVGPPLAESDWALGSEERLIRIVLHGVRGTIDVNDETYNLEMPAMAFFNDEDIASILTYIRRAWGNQGEAVSVDSVASIRRATRDRRDSWTADELLKIP